MIFTNVNTCKSRGLVKSIKLWYTLAVELSLTMRLCSSLEIWMHEKVSETSRNGLGKAGSALLLQAGVVTPGHQGQAPVTADSCVTELQF